MYELNETVADLDSITQTSNEQLARVHSNEDHDEVLVLNVSAPTRIKRGCPRKSIEGKDIFVKESDNCDSHIESAPTIRLQFLDSHIGSQVR